MTDENAPPGGGGGPTPETAHHTTNADSHHQTADTPSLTPWPGFDPNHASRVGAAVRQIGELLADGDWRGWRDIVTTAATTHRLKPTTVDSLLRGMIQTGCIERRGRYEHRGRRDRPDGAFSVPAAHRGGVRVRRPHIAGDALCAPTRDSTHATFAAACAAPV